MILVKTAKEVEAMKPACQISAEALRLGGEAVKPGVTTAQIDKIIYDYIVSQGARPNFKGLGGFPGSACISVNDVVIHGIPSHGIVLHEGDIVSIDTGAVFPLHAGAAGKVLMCSIGDDAIEQYYLRYGTRHTDATIMTIPEMKEELHQIGIRGYAVDNGEYMPEIRAVAAPIKDAYGAIIAAVSVAYPVSNQDSIAPAHLATQVMQTAHAISLTYAAKEAWPQPAKLVHA